MLAGLRAGDPGAFERLYLDQAGSVYNLCLRILRSPEDAQDVTQEIFIKAYDRLPGSTEDLRLKAWLNRVAVNACYDHLRSRREHDELDTVSEAGAPQARDAIEQAELGQMIEQTLDSLSVDQRTVLLLKDVQGLTQDEIAGALGVSTSATETRLFRAREAFRLAYAQVAGASRDQRCHLAQQASVKSVGGRLSKLERRRLLRHARHCPDCRKTVQTWGAATVGLAILLPQVPLPASLLASPFAALGAGAAGGGVAAVAAGGATVGAGSGAAGGGLAAVGAAGAGTAGATAAGAGATVTGVAATAAGAIAAKVAIVAIAATALTATAVVGTHQIQTSRARHAAGVVAARAAAAAAAPKGAKAGAPDNGQQPLAGRGDGHGAKAGAGHGAKAPGKAKKATGRGAAGKADAAGTANGKAAVAKAGGAGKAAAAKAGGKAAKAARGKAGKSGGGKAGKAGKAGGGKGKAGHGGGKPRGREGKSPRPKD